MRIIAVIPTYNEADNILPLIGEVLKQSPNLEVLVVDDYSPDGTWSLVEREAKGNSRVHLLLRKKDRGRGLAGLEGIRRAIEMRADRVVEMDADFSHDPGDLPRLLDASDGADLVVGSRYVEGGTDEERGILRRLVSLFARNYLKCVLGLKVSDPTSGYRCFGSGAFRSLMSEGISARGPFIITEILFHCHREGLRIIEVPINFRRRRTGSSKLGALTLTNYLFQAVRLRLASLCNRE